MQDKHLIGTAKNVLDNCFKAKAEAEHAVNDILHEHQGEVIALDDPAYVLVDRYGWTETAIRSVKMNDDELILLSTTFMTSSTPEFGVITEDDDNVNVNWPSLLEALIHALTKEKKTEPQKHSYSANLTIRIDYESDRELDGEDLNDLVGNLAIKTVSKTKGVEIISTEICGLND